jgi:RsiW-degrading membrane proteinase PrsW (M82 family)
LNPFIVALTYAVVGAAVIAIVLALFKTPHQLWEVVAAALVGAALSFVPTEGGIASLAGTLGVLFWCLGRGYATDIFVSVAVARLVMVPILLMLINEGTL